MTQVIVILLFPIGLYFYFFVERKAKASYQKVFDDFQNKVQANTKLSDKEKLRQYKEMLYTNDYTIVKSTETSVQGEKRIFYMSLLAMGLGLYFVGAIIYLIYFYFIQKPHVVVYEV